MNDLVTSIAERALTFLTDPPAGDDPVVVHADPAALIEVFDGSVGLSIDGEAPPADPAALLDAVDLVIRHSVHTSHPRFMNQNFAGPDPVAVVGDWLGAALNTTGATFEAAPVFTLMESAVLTELARLAGLSDASHGRLPASPPGMFCPGGSTATLYALQLARHRLRPDTVRTGATGERFAVFVSDAGHYAARKSAALLGFGSEAVVDVASHDDGSIDPAALGAAIGSAREAGRTPLAVIATAGTTVTSAFDDIDAVADVCDANELWLHVDGCYGGSALFSPSQRHLLAGVERADSFVWNLHKMMGITQQCTVLLVRDPGQLASCFASRADYLFQPDKLNAEWDSGDRTFQCARRVDVVKLWLTWKFHGSAGFAARVDRAVELAEFARSAIADSDGALATVVAGTFTNVVFAWVPPDLRPLALGPTDIDRLDAATRDRLHGLPPRIKARMLREGTAMIGFQPVCGLNTFRLIVMNPEVTTDDIDGVLALVERYGADLGRSTTT